ncbi:P-loop containing nucleoside triphosphate hydrolase protein [Mycena filopes]|nr:P-loop containing nucleoside triphosphate hydrolase protein [Mycena filopes]
MDELDASDALFPTVNSREWLELILRHRCKVASVRPFQLDLGMEIIGGKDVWCVIATGMGKTVLLQAGAIAADARKECGICLIIVPTKVLVEQQAEVATARGLRALAINEDTVREAALVKRDLWLELTRGDDVRVAVMTPQMAQGRRMQQLLNSPSFVNHVRWVSIDEAGLVDQKEGVFAAHYLRLSTLRVKLNDSTVWVAVTATATTERAPIMARMLGFRPGAYVDRRYSVNRPNLKYIPCFYQHATTGTEHLDLSFIVPPGMKSAGDIVSTLVFARHIGPGFSIMDFLDTLIPPDIPNASQLIKLYNGLMSGPYRRKLKEDFESGEVRVMIVTDTAAYGFDVPNARRVVTTDLETYFEESEQKWGRGGRDGELAEVIAFAPAWVQNLPPGTVLATKTQKDEEEKRSQLLGPTRAWFNAIPSFCSRRAALHYNSEAFPFNSICPDCCGPIHDPDASKIDLARVQIWKEHFARLEERRASVSERPRTDGAFRALDKPMRESLTHMLDRWSHRMWNQIRPSRELPCSVFFPPFIRDAILDKAHLCTELSNLKIITKRWEYFEQCGAILLKFLVETMTGFDKIYYDLTRAEGSDVDVTLPVAQPLSKEAQTLSRYTNVAILKVLCRENGCGSKATSSRTPSD